MTMPRLIPVPLGMLHGQPVQLVDTPLPHAFLGMGRGFSQSRTPSPLLLLDDFRPDWAE
jgi:hypothetical protein